MSFWEGRGAWERVPLSMMMSKLPLRNTSIRRMSITRTATNANARIAQPHSCARRDVTECACWAC